MSIAFSLQNFAFHVRLSRNEKIFVGEIFSLELCEDDMRSFEVAIEEWRHCAEE